jgi:hypothetical protein
MTARLTADQVRIKLHALGVRRNLLRGQHQQLLDDTAEALALARGLVPVAEAASLCGVARSTAYVLGRSRGDDADGGTNRATP